MGSAFRVSEHSGHSGLPLPVKSRALCPRIFSKSASLLARACSKHRARSASEALGLPCRFTARRGPAIARLREPCLSLLHKCIGCDGCDGSDGRGIVVVCGMCIGWLIWLIWLMWLDGSFETDGFLCSTEGRSRFCCYLRIFLLFCC